MKTLKRINHWLIDLLNEFGNHMMSLFFVLLLFLLFWVVPQINDLIVVINQAENDWLVVLIFFSSLTVLAFLISTVDNYFNPNIPSRSESEVAPESTGEDKSQRKPSIFQIPQDAKERYLEQRSDEVSMRSTLAEFNETQAQYIRRLFPKILGTILILIVTYSVNNTYFKVYEKDIVLGGNWGMLIGIILLLLILNKTLADKVSKRVRKYSWTHYVPISIALGCLFGVVVLGLFNQGGSQGDTRRLFYSLFMLSIFFLLVTTSYTRLILKFKKRFGAKIIFGLVIMALVAYLILVINPQAIKSITPLSIILVCTIGIFTLLNIIRLIGYRHTIPLLSIVLILSIALAIYTANNSSFNHFEATYVPTQIQVDSRLELNTYVKEWITDRQSDIRQHTETNKFPIIIVSAEGGGSRAGLWSFLVQSYLYDRNPDYFKKYLFSITGASGGGVGNNMFYTQAYNLQEKTSTVPFKYGEPLDNKLKYRASSIYDKDYLSTSVASAMGRDLFKSISNIGTFSNRGTLLEDEWEASFNKAFDYDILNESPLAKAYLSMMPERSSKRYIKPLLITNTTHLQSGQRTVISPVAIAKDTHNMGVFIDLLAEYPNKKRMIKRSTAMSLNARFPYVSPAARIDSVGQFGDAGYYDNVGGTVTRRLRVALAAQLMADTTLRGKYEIKHLLITNYEKPWDIVPISYSSQLTIPPAMIWNATFAHAKEMEKTFTKVYNIQSKPTPITEYKPVFSFTSDLLPEGEMLPMIPLGRYLSIPAVRSLEKRLENDTVKRKLDNLIPEG